MGKPNNMILLTILLVSVILFIFQVTSKNPQCNDLIECVNIPRDAPVKIGVIHHIAGEGLSIDRERINFVKLAVSDRDNKIYEHPIVLISKAIECSEAAGEKATIELATDSSLLGIVSIVCPTATAAAARTSSDLGLVLMSGTDMSPRMNSLLDKSTAIDNPGFFRTIYNTAEMGKAAAEFAFRKLGKTHAAVIYENKISSKSTASVFESVYKKLGGTVSLTSTMGNQGEKLSEILPVILSVQPEFLFLTASPLTSSKLISQIKKQDVLSNLVIMGGINLLRPEFVTAIAPNDQEIFFIDNDIYEIGPGNDRLISDYKSMFGISPMYRNYGQVYDAVTLLILTIKAAMQPPRQGALVFARQRLRDIIAQTVNFKAVTGSLTCDQHGECGVSRFRILKLEDPSKGLTGLRQNTVFIYSSH